MTKLGIMQGRLVPPEPGRFQAFPRDRWASEFDLARQVPVSYIEWIFDLYGADVNPLWNDLSQIKSVINRTGVMVRSICADYFMDLPFLRCTEPECRQRQEVLHKLLRIAHEINIDRVILPFVDASRIETHQDQSRVKMVLEEALPIAEETGVELHLETALGPSEFARFLDLIPSALVKVNYDSGNSSSLGFDPAAEFAAYGDRIGSIHIKDRVRGGGTVPLGTGDADLRAVFDGMSRLDYRGDITMQVARSEPGREVEWARLNREFVARYWPVD